MGKLCLIKTKKETIEDFINNNKDKELTTGTYGFIYIMKELGHTIDLANSTIRPIKKKEDELSFIKIGDSTIYIDHNHDNERNGFDLDTGLLRNSCTLYANKR